MRSRGVLVFAVAVVSMLLLASAARAVDGGGWGADGVAAQGNRTQIKALKIMAFFSILV
jgi:hypothetical protein